MYELSHRSRTAFASVMSLMEEAALSRKMVRTLIWLEILLATSHAMRAMRGSIRWSSL